MKILSSYLFSFYFAFKYDQEIPLPVVTVASRALAEKCVLSMKWLQPSVVLVSLQLPFVLFL